MPDGALLALPPDYSMPAMAVVRALIVQKKRELRLLGAWGDTSGLNEAMRELGKWLGAETIRTE